MNDAGIVATQPKISSDTTIFSLLHAAHALEDKLERALNRVDLSTPKYSVLNELIASGIPLSLSDLATRLSCVRSNMTQLVDRLEADHLVRRVDHPSDRRGVKAEITEVGRARHAAGAAEVARLHEEFADSVGEGDRAALARLLTALK
ncbi:MAG: MarR family winged helix-turn-helix transcriptional regulator [Deltaproteobacteria bacterium]